MFTLRRLSLALMFIAPAAYADDSPTPAEFSALLVEHIIAMEGPESAALGDAYAKNLLLEDPSSIYSNLKKAGSNDFSRAWDAAMREVKVSGQRAFELYAHEMGLTKARPGIDIMVSPVFATDLRGFPLSPVTGANLTKAAVDPDIYRASILSIGFPQSSLAANYAVGAQILRDALSGIADAEERDDLDLRSDVLDRFVQMDESSELSDDDADYLKELLYTEITTMTGGVSPGFGLAYVPAQFRVARLAAAYHEQTGYFTEAPCTREGWHEPSAGTGAEGDLREICSSDATDQAVYAAYIDRYREQVEGAKRYPDKVVYVSKLAQLMRPFALIAEVTGIGSFINYTTGLRSLFRGTVTNTSTRAMRSKILEAKCRF